MDDSLSEFIDSTLQDIAPSEIVYRLDLLEQLDNGTAGEAFDDEQKEAFRRTLKQEIAEWQAHLFSHPMNDAEVE